MARSKLIHRWRGLDRQRRMLLVEATVALAAASAAVRFLPFKRAVRLGSRHLPSAVTGDMSAQVRWAVEAASRRAPWRSVCFQKGLALQWMLRRRGADATLHYGIARAENGELSAHVWVVEGDRILIGGEQAPNFRSVATFP
jgi:hypothetical protein